MGAAQYVGRVGSLAVALGLGTAVFTGYGVASAAPDSSESSSGSSVSSSPSGPADTGARTNDAGGAPTSSGSSSSAPSRSTRTKRSAATESDGDESRGGAKHGATAVTAPSAASTSHTVHVRARSDDTTPGDKGPEDAASSGAAAVVAPPTDNPGTPTEPAGWILLSYARRELDDTLSPRLPSAKPAGSATSNGLVANVATLNQEVASPNLTQVNLAADTRPSVMSGDEQPVFTGQPTLVSDVFVAVLRIAHEVLGLFGVENVPPAQLPIFSDGTPPLLVTLGLNVQRSEFDGMPVYTLQQPGSTSEEVVVGLHGGAYVGQISLFQWWTYADVARDTGATVVVPVYPLAPEGTAAVVVPEMADFLSQLIDEHGSDNVSVFGDSAGGGLALAAVQELVRRGSPTPSRMVLLGPWLDATVSDPESQTIPDPILDAGVLKDAGVLWAGDLDPSDPLVSPLNGSLRGLPPTWVYTSSLDLLAPQTERLREQALADGLTNFNFVFREGEVHVWPTYPFLPETAADLSAIESELLGTDVKQPDPFRELVALILELVAL